MTENAPKRRRRRSLRRVLGAMPIDDSLGVVSWTIRALGLCLLEVDADRELSPRERRAEVVKIAGAMSKLRDIDRLGRAEDTLRGHQRRIEDTRGDGPQLEAAVPADELAWHGITARRGKPPPRGGGGRGPLR